MLMNQERNLSDYQNKYRKLLPKLKEISNNNPEIPQQRKIKELKEPKIPILKIKTPLLPPLPSVSVEWTSQEVSTLKETINQFKSSNDVIDWFNVMKNLEKQRSFQEVYAKYLEFNPASPNQVSDSSKLRSGLWSMEEVNTHPQSNQIKSIIFFLYSFYFSWKDLNLLSMFLIFQMEELIGKVFNC